MGFLNRFKKTTWEKQVAEPTPSVAPIQTTAPAVARTGLVSEVIVRPLVTEKAAILASANTYVFVVKSDANRLEIRQAIAQMYGMMPVRVNIQRVEGKWKRFGRNVGKRSDWKKALVTLPKGKTINVHEGV